MLKEIECDALNSVGVTQEFFKVRVNSLALLQPRHLAALLIQFISGYYVYRVKHFTKKFFNCLKNSMQSNTLIGKLRATTSATIAP